MKSPSDLAISRKHQKQIERANKRVSNRFFEEYITPIIYLPEQDLHVPMFNHKKGNFSQQPLEKMLEKFKNDIVAVQLESALFCNPLKLAIYDPQKKKQGVSSGFTIPSNRVTNGGWVVFTFEHDGPDAAALEMQLDWFVGKPEKCPFNQVHNALSKYSDYRGYSTISSGHKSLHIDIIFDIRHLSKELAKTSKWANKVWSGDVPDVALAELYREIWWKLEAIIKSSLNVNVEFDPRMASYTQKRRSPWGTRRFEGSDNIHGFKKDDQIAQSVIQENILTRAPKNATGPLITSSAAKMIMDVQRHSQNSPSPRPVSDRGSVILLNELKGYLRAEGWPQYPEPVVLEYQDPHNYVFFKNHANDRNPRTLIRGDYRMMLPAGVQAHTNGLFFPHQLTLDETLEVLEQRTNVINGTQLFATEPPKRKAWTPKNQFAEKAKNIRSARVELGSQMYYIVRWPGATLLQAPEGIGKTFALMQMIQEARWDHEAHRFQQSEYQESDWSPTKGFICFAVKSYEQAYAKSCEYREIAPGSPSTVVVKSVSYLYGEACKILDADPQNREHAGRNGASNYLQSIAQNQPDVYEKMCELRDEMWNTDGINKFHPNSTVIFVVHQLVQNWPHSHISKAFLHPMFPNDFDQEQIEKCKKEMALYQVVFDEVSWEDLASIDTAKQVKLSAKIKKKSRKISKKPWDETSLAIQVRAYDSVMQKSSGPSLSFDDCNRIIRSKYTKHDKIRVNTKKFPFGKGTDEHNIYAKTNKTAYYCKKQRWWDDIGCPVIILTTEDLPRTIASNIDSIRTVNRTETPYLFNDIVPVWFDERARAPCKKNRQNVVDLANELFEEGFDFIISNSLQSLESPLKEQTCSHKSAQGRNDLTNYAIATILTYPSIAEYEQHCILGQKFGIEKPTAMAMRDTVFQNLGRNLGFRYQVGQMQMRHYLFIKPSLYRDIGLLQTDGFDRYKFYLDSIT